MFGIQGLNPWNILLLLVLIAWQTNRQKDGQTWDMPQNVNILLILYLAVIVIGFIRMLIDPDGLIIFALITGSQDIPSTLSLISEHFINAIKWVVPGLLLFHGCNSRSRFNLAVFSILSIYVILAVQVIHYMPVGAITAGLSFDRTAAKILEKEVGFHRVNLSMM